MKTVKQSKSADSNMTKPIVKKAAIVAVMIGGILTLSGQQGAIFGEADFQVLPMTLAFLTPFLVVVISQVFGIREARKALTHTTENRQTFVGTLFSHGIPTRAVALGLTAGVVNTAIVATAYVMIGKNLDQLPVSLIVQAVTLPIIFGAFSQALSFRSTVRLRPLSA